MAVSMASAAAVMLSVRAGMSASAMQHVMGVREIRVHGSTLRESRALEGRPAEDSRGRGKGQRTLAENSCADVLPLVA